MTRLQRGIGFTATLAIALILVTAIAREPQRQEIARQAHIDQSIERVIDLYVYNCVQCHGPAGEGFDVNPPLNDDVVRQKDPAQLYRVIERGRFGTDMAAFGIDEGGNLTNVQIDGMVSLIMHGDWDEVYERTEQLDLLPTPTTTSTATPTMPPTSTATFTATLTASPTLAPPTTTPAQPAPPTGSPFDIVPTAVNDAPLFDVIPTETPTSDVPLFEVVPTEMPANATEPESPFQVVPTQADSPAENPIQPVPTETDD